METLPCMVIGEDRNVNLMDRFLQTPYLKSVSPGRHGNSCRGSCSSHEKLLITVPVDAIASIKTSGRRHDDMVIQRDMTEQGMENKERILPSPANSLQLLEFTPFLLYVHRLLAMALSAVIAYHSHLDEKTCCKTKNLAKWRHVIHFGKLSHHQLLSTERN